MKIVLAYRRTPERLSFFTITVFMDTEVVWAASTGADWKTLMTTFAKALAAFPAVKDVYVQRTDRPGLVALQISEAEVELWRVDPITAMAGWTVPDQVGHLREGKSVRLVEQSVNAVPPLRAGGDTLAQCFGDVVYARARGPVVECFVCGHWVSLSEDVRDPHYHCRSCGDTVHTTNPYGLSDWQGVWVERLLTSPSNRFYLPRAWNRHGKWIIKVQLEEMYTQYKKDKEQATS